MITRTPSDLGFKEIPQKLANNNQRELSVDVARGIGIILVVFGHTFQIYSITSYIYSFHIPLFFLLSGLTFNTEKYFHCPKRFLRDRFLKLIIPYFIAAMFSYVLYVFVAPTLSLPKIDVDSAAIGILSGNGNALPFNLGLWFLPAFFFAGIIFLALTLSFKGMKLFIGVFLVSISGILIGTAYSLPFGLDIAMATQIFIYCGYLLKKAQLLAKIRNSKTRSITICILAQLLLIVMFSLSSMNDRIDLMTRAYGEPVLFFVTGLVGSISILMFSIFLSMRNPSNNYVSKFFQFIGKASMSIFMTHILIFYCVASVFALLWGFWVYYTFATFWYLLLALGLFIPSLVYFLLIFIGKKPMIKKIPVLLLRSLGVKSISKKDFPSKNIRIIKKRLNSHYHYTE